MQKRIRTIEAAKKYRLLPTPRATLRWLQLSVQQGATDIAIVAPTIAVESVAVADFHASLDFLTSISKPTLDQIRQHPRFHCWTYRALRLLANRLAEDQQGELECHLRDFGRFALGAALLEGRKFSTLVPVNGLKKITLPGANLRIELRDSLKKLAQVEAVEGRVTIDRRLARTEPIVTESGFELAVGEAETDHLGISGYQPAAEQDINVSSWRASLFSAYQLLKRDEKALSLVNGFARVIVPLIGAGSDVHLSMTLRSLPGMILMSWSSYPEVIAEALVHEADHNYVYALDRRHPLWVEPVVRQSAAYRSPWRIDPRPLNGLLVGASAFVSISEFLCVATEVATEPLCNAVSCEQRALLATLQAADALRLVTRYGKLSNSGAALVSDLVLRQQCVEAQLKRRPRYPQHLKSVLPILQNHNIAWETRHGAADHVASTSEGRVGELQM